jgi:alkanesulfonate monooxygenase SsuD/methylene tetrahydromethanopterin reductase-like flavin-dependent oxidoreductase (luciferase family)
MTWHEQHATPKAGLRTMQISVRLPTDRSSEIPEFGTGAGLVQFARTAEAAGFTSVHESDHPFPSRKWPRLAAIKTTTPS